MPMPCYLYVEGTNQGKIEGSCRVTGHEGMIIVQGLDHTVTIPTNPQTGQAAGKRVHGAMTLTKEVDKSSPKIYQALCSGEQMKEVRLEYYRISPAGKEEKYYTVKLSNAIVVNVRAWVPNCLVSDNSQLGHMEDIAFTYEKVVWTWVPDGIEAEDSWLAPKA
jgi:type VI secretion system secreted protein Hcp